MNELFIYALYFEEKCVYIYISFCRLIFLYINLKSLTLISNHLCCCVIFFFRFFFYNFKYSLEYYFYISTNKNFFFELHFLCTIIFTIIDIYKVNMF